MKSEKASPELKKIKTGRIERRLSLASTGLLMGSRFATDMWSGMLVPKDKRGQHRRDAVTRQAKYLVEELSKLKGSVVKVGQVMAMYGEHILPEEVVTALRTLEESTIPVQWSVMEAVLRDELGDEVLAELDIDETSLAAASLGQVHLATRKSDGAQICLKIQYPGVADSIDNDMLDVVQLLKLGRVISAEMDFDELFEEVRQILHREVDYYIEANTTREIGLLLSDDPRFVVPTVYDEYSSRCVLATSYEEGYVVSAPELQTLSDERRSAMGKAFLDLFFKEVFVWSTMQSDPNFGNYRIRPARDEKTGSDLIVLLDFGAVIKYPESFTGPVRKMIAAAVAGDLDSAAEAAVSFGMFSADTPEPVKHSFAEVCFSMVEPLRPCKDNLPPQALNAAGEYVWSQSDLPKRVAKQAAKSAFNKHFQVPPKEFTFLSRKLLGVYALIEALDAKFDAWPVFKPYAEMAAKE